MRIYTAGYGNRGFERYVELLKSYGVTHLVDVRSVPQSSYWEDFRRERLERIVPPTGLHYVYMGDTLGGVYNSASACKSPETFDPSAAAVEPRFQVGLEKLIAAASDKSKVICLMCACLRPHRCHRSRLVGRALSERGVEVLHLDEKGEPKAQAVIEEESRNPQGTLF